MKEVRDTNTEDDCEDFDPDLRENWRDLKLCESDGHYRCRECRWLKEPEITLENGF